MIKRVCLALVALALMVSPGYGDAPLPPGFTVTVFAITEGVPTSLAFGRDTRDGADRAAQRLYVTDFVGNRVMVFDDLGGVAGRGVEFATGFRSPLGVVAGPDGSVYVADAESARQGPYGLRVYGRVWRVRDTDGDGIGDQQKVVIKDLPNGRHNTNGMAFGPDGMLYVTNGNSTDDGVEGGEAEVVPWSGSLIRVNPSWTDVSLADLPVRRTLVATGWRNVYDVAFSPVQKGLALVPMNGTDDARQGSTGENPLDPNLEDSDDLLYATKVTDTKIDDFGFPSCLFNLAEKGDLQPYENPNPDVIDTFGRCPRSVPRPIGSFGLHPSANGLAFQATDRWGDDFRNDVFVAEWGSLFGMPSGHKVVRVELDGSGAKVEAMSDFFEIDLPIDVTFDAAGVMYVADFSGQIFRIDKV
jgi:glucose/arabinose dehydrogenase